MKERVDQISKDLPEAQHPQFVVEVSLTGCEEDLVKIKHGSSLLKSAQCPWGPREINKMSRIKKRFEETALSDDQLKMLKILVSDLKGQTQ